MGGGDERDNLVQLTAEEHFVAHQLLHKIYPHVSGLAFAMVNMIGNPYGYRSNKLYGWIRRKVALTATVQMKERFKDPEYRRKHIERNAKLREDPAYVAKLAAVVSKAHKGRVKSPQERANIAAAGRKRKPRVFSGEARANMAAARRKTWEERRANGTAGEIAAKTVATRRKNGSYEFSEEWRRKIGAAAKGKPSPNKGKKASLETRLKQSEAAKRRYAGEAEMGA